MSRYRLSLNLILEMIERIEKSNWKFLSKRGLLWDATLMRLQVIGENILKIPLEIKKKYPKIKWANLSKTRNIISHSYANVNPLIIKRIIKEELIPIKTEFKKMAREVGDEK